VGHSVGDLFEAIAVVVRRSVAEIGAEIYNMMQFDLKQCFECSKTAQKMYF